MSSLIERAASPPRTRAHRFALATVRGFATVQAVCAVLQPIFIGLYLDGHYGALFIHEMVASALLFTALGTLVASVVLTRASVRRTRLPIVAFVLLLAVVAQASFGYGRLLSLHIPLGVGVVAAALVLCWWSWARAGQIPSRPRRVRKAPGQ